VTLESSGAKAIGDLLWLSALARRQANFIRWNAFSVLNAWLLAQQCEKCASHIIVNPNE